MNLLRDVSKRRVLTCSCCGCTLRLAQLRRQPSRLEIWTPDYTSQWRPKVRILTLTNAYLIFEAGSSG
jgi:hypothetical protein